MVTLFLKGFKTCFFSFKLVFRKDENSEGAKLTCDEHINAKWTRVKSNLWNNDLHTSKGCDSKTLGSRTDAYLTILNDIGFLSNIFSII